MKRIKLFAIASALLASFSAIAALPPQLPSLLEGKSFSTRGRAAFLEETAASIIPSEPAVKRERTVQLDPIWFEAPSDQIKLNLFAGMADEVDIENVEQIGRTTLFYAHFAKEFDTSVIFAYEDETMSAWIRYPDGRVFDVRFVGSGLHKIREIDPIRAQLCGMRPNFGLQVNPDFADTTTSFSITPGSSSLVDVMVLYTPAMLTSAGGAAAMNTLIALAIGCMNEALHKSAIAGVQVRLVYRGQITYTESGDSTTDLSWLRNSTTVATLRSQYAADLVSMMVAGFANEPSITGRGYMLSEGGTYSVVKQASAWAFTHELGHNFGCDHDRANRYGGGSYSYSYGYSFTPPNPPNVNNLVFGDIMSYVGSELQQFSNPGVYFMGVATGVADNDPLAADNATTILNTAATVAGSANSKMTILTAPTLTSGDTQFTFAISGPGQGTYTVEYTSNYSNWSTLGNYTLSSGSVLVTDSFGTNSCRFYRARLGGAYLSTQLGFLKMTIPNGKMMIANPFETGNNVVGALLPSVPDGTQLLKWVEGTQNWAVNSYAFGSWSSPNMTMHPGEGVIIQNTGAAFIAKFVGFVNEAFDNRIPTQYAVRSSAAPQQGGITGTLLYSLGGLGNGDQVQKMQLDGTYRTYTWNGNSWDTEPQIGIGEAFWTMNPVNAFVWSRVLFTWP